MGPAELKCESALHVHDMIRFFSQCANGRYLSQGFLARLPPFCNQSMGGRASPHLLSLPKMAGQTISTHACTHATCMDFHLHLWLGLWLLDFPLAVLSPCLSSLRLSLRHGSCRAWGPGRRRLHSQSHICKVKGHRQDALQGSTWCTSPKLVWSCIRAATQCVSVEP
jgi:hypothetical protein